MTIKPLYLSMSIVLCLLLTAFAIIGINGTETISVSRDVSLGMTRAAALSFASTTTPNFVVELPMDISESLKDEAVPGEEMVVVVGDEDSSDGLNQEPAQALDHVDDSAEVEQRQAPIQTPTPTPTLVLVKKDTGEATKAVPTEVIPTKIKIDELEKTPVIVEEEEDLVATNVATSDPETEPTADEQPQRPTVAIENADPNTKTAAPEDVETLVKTRTPTPTMTPTTAPTAAPTQVPTHEPDPDYFWFAGHEDGTISEWEAHGDFLRQGNTGVYSVVQSNAHSGNYSVKLQINTATGSGNQAAYLFYWDELPDAAYYSAWYYIPTDTNPGEWWNLMQWKSTYNGNSDYSRPMFVLDASVLGKMKLSLCYLPDGPEKICMTQNIAKVPTGQWFHIEAFYDRDPKKGRFIVWQDGVELYDIDYLPTVLSDRTLHWSVNTYTPAIYPSPSYILIDDAAIAFERIGP